MRLLYHSLAFYLALVSPSAAASSSASATSTAAATPSSTIQPCTIRSPNTHAFFDLNPLHIYPPDTSPKLLPKHAFSRKHSWNTTGYDIGYNFTLNFCGSVVEDLDAKGGVVGVEKEQWGNVSAYYEAGGKVWSIGQQSQSPVLRGRKLVLNYTDGSPCDIEDVREGLRHSVDDLSSPREIVDDDDDDDKKGDEKKKPKTPSKAKGVRRKNTLISFLCDRDPLSSSLTLSFIGTSPDSCTYLFEARTPHGCGGIAQATQTLSPSGVFGVIVGIAFLVYVVGGVFYGRVVLQQRGWRQLPNYGLWAGIGGFFRDIFIILTSSCARFLPSRRGYQRVNGGIGGGSGGGGSRGRGRGDSDAENRLIDELNEEWDD